MSICFLLCSSVKMCFLVRPHIYRNKHYKTFEEARDVLKGLVDAYRHNEKVWTVMENKTK